MFAKYWHEVIILLGLYPTEEELEEMIDVGWIARYIIYSD